MSFLPTFFCSVGLAFEYSNFFDRCGAVAVCGDYCSVRMVSILQLLHVDVLPRGSFGTCNNFLALTTRTRTLSVGAVYCVQESQYSAM